MFMLIQQKMTDEMINQPKMLFFFFFVKFTTGFNCKIYSDLVKQQAAET